MPANVVTSVVASHPGRTSMRVTWTDGASPNTLNEVYRATSASFAASSFIGMVAQGVQLFRDSDLTPGTAYYYYVRGRNAADSIASAVGPGTDTTIGDAGDEGDDFVQQIIQAMQARIVDLLPTQSKQLDYVYDLEKNPKLAGWIRYGVRPGESQPGAAAVFGSYTQEQNFEVIFSMDTDGGSTDKDVETGVFEIGKWVDRVIREYKASRLFLPTFVLRVADPKVSKPEMIPGTQSVYVILTFPIMFRNTLLL